MRKTALTTGELATHCHVSPDTVINWIKSGKLKAYTTPGGHRRISIEQLESFLRAYDLPPLDQGPGPRRKVLVVDDDPHIRRLIMKGLSAPEYEMAFAADGFEAGLQVLKFRPDLVILDLMMPQMDGFKLCRKIKSTPETRQVLVLVMTGYATEENLKKALEAGADCCLAKPFTMKTLRQTLQEIWMGTYRMPRVIRA